ncbi:uracil-DNA glycosylase [Nitriliruptoraceae bacterium ZYF776]|nr:uracil-DNA glycosylase [Profundirhabdus halotolerans]
MSADVRPLAELVGPGWEEVLAPVEPTIRALGDFLRAEAREGRGFLPSSERIFAAFQQPFERVRVLVVGQDPYPTPGHPIGLSFAVAPDVQPLPGSLRNIFREYQDDLGHPPPATGDLTPWVAQGVLLLNRCLTVRPGAPASHRGRGWETVTDAVIDGLVARGTPLVAVLWGRDARSLAPRLADVPRVESAHPSPLSAARGFLGSRPFSRVDALLAERGAEPIDWRLPS